ncbi:dethiobiotin synthetase [Breznakibacter xylanolyticus]|uniref:ATP-dependent dethiobiotin synthetase BioD n=1 Tax=Breznakibacter xylanolyticus TaxID=990 RepID=A0A2W7NMZ6_9BACT|nr:dethiobiotin synthase [Breznakibacter xylanolyticus]PZX18034.1 dethiobiotin synthetase [Breznakibacter xylanolyticus]
MIHFITAIDTDAGKSIATGVYARQLMQQGHRVITMKVAQTGCTGMSDDIVTHRRLMGIDLLPEDVRGDTCPYLFPFPASPHLSAALAGQVIDPAHIEACVARLSGDYDRVVVEGVGGLMVPLTRVRETGHALSVPSVGGLVEPLAPGLLLIDWVAQQGWPVVLVTSARLGSINHTLLSLEAIHRRGMPLAGIIFNQYPPAPQAMAADTREVIRGVVQRDFAGAFWMELPVVEME